MQREIRAGALDREETALQDVEGSPVDLAQVIEESIQFASENLLGGDVATVAEYPAHLPAVSGDYTHLVQVAACLLQQAGSLSDSGEISVRASLLTMTGEEPSHLVGEPPASLREGGPWVLLSVGFQVDDDKADQLDSLRGLTTWETSDCQEKLAAFGDHFWLTDLENAIHRFDLALPVWGAYEIDTATSSLRQAVETRLGGEARETTLLLLVENDELRAHLSTDLESAGYHVIQVATGGEVMPLAREEEPDLVLLDLVARAPTAFEVAGILKHDRRTRNLPVLFLTSVDDPSGELSMGTVGFLPRQSDTGAIISAINAVLTSGLSPMSRVLVVENDDRLRDHMVMTIQGQGYRVSEARTPEEAMALAERATPDVALINARLAQERDYWLLRGLRTAASEAEIYVMADVLDEEEARLAMRRGASGYSETGQLPDLLERMRKRPDADN